MKAKKTYTVEEASDMLGVDRTTLLLMLGAFRDDVKPDTKQIKTADLERLYQMLRSKP